MHGSVAEAAASPKMADTDDELGFHPLLGATFHWQGWDPLASGVLGGRGWLDWRREGAGRQSRR